LSNDGEHCTPWDYDEGVRERQQGSLLRFCLPCSRNGIFASSHYRNPHRQSEEVRGGGFHQGELLPASPRVPAV
jgi:hypothetical protein